MYCVVTHAARRPSRCPNSLQFHKHIRPRDTHARDSSTQWRHYCWACPVPCVRRHHDCSKQIRPTACDPYCNSTDALLPVHTFSSVIPRWQWRSSVQRPVSPLRQHMLLPCCGQSRNSCLQSSRHFPTWPRTLTWRWVTRISLVGPASRCLQTGPHAASQGAAQAVQGVQDGVAICSSFQHHQHIHSGQQSHRQLCQGAQLCFPQINIHTPLP